MITVSQNIWPLLDFDKYTFLKDIPEEKIIFLTEEIKKKISELSKDEQKEIAEEMVQHYLSESSNLRKFQKQTFLKLIDFLKDWHRKWLIKQPTWAWKTRLFWEINKTFLKKRKNSLILVPFSWLVTDTASEFEKFWISNDRVNIVNPSDSDNSDNWKSFIERYNNNLWDDWKTTIMTYSSFNGLMKKEPKLMEEFAWKMDLIISDEAHKWLWDIKIDNFEKIDDWEKKFLYFTATPKLLKKTVLDTVDWIKLVDSVSIQEVVEEWNLVMPTQINVWTARKTLSKEKYDEVLEYSKKDLGNFLDNSRYEIDLKSSIEVITDAYLEKKNNDLNQWALPWVAFCSTIKETEEYVKYLKTKWIKAETVTSWSKMTPSEGKEKIKNWEIDLVVTVSKVWEWWDVPELRAALWLTPRNSHSMKIQWTGRIMRENEWKSSENTYIFEANYKVWKYNEEKDSKKTEDNTEEKDKKGDEKKDEILIYESKSYYQMLLEDEELTIDFLERNMEKFGLTEEMIISLKDKIESEVDLKNLWKDSLKDIFNKPEELISNWLRVIWNTVNIKWEDIKLSYILKNEKIEGDSIEWLIKYVWWEDELKRVLEVKNEINKNELISKWIFYYLYKTNLGPYSNIRYCKKLLSEIYWDKVNMDNISDESIKYNLIKLGLTPWDFENPEEVMNNISKKIFWQKLFFSLDDENFIKIKEIIWDWKDFLKEDWNWVRSSNSIDIKNWYWKIKISELYKHLPSKFIRKSLSDKNLTYKSWDISKTAVILKYFLDKDLFENLLLEVEYKQYSKFYDKINSREKLLKFFKSPESIIKSGKKKVKYIINLTGKWFDEIEKLSRIKKWEAIYWSDLIALIKNYLIKNEDFKYNSKISSYENLVVYLFWIEELNRVLKIENLNENIKKIREIGIKIFYNENWTINYNLKHFKQAFYWWKNKISDINWNYKKNLVEWLWIPEETEIVEKIKDDKDNINFINILSQNIFWKTIEYSIVPDRDNLKNNLKINDFLDNNEKDNSKTTEFLDNFITEKWKWQAATNSSINTEHFWKVSIDFLLWTLDNKEKQLIINLSNSKDELIWWKPNNTEKFIKYLLTEEEFDKVYAKKEEIREEYLEKRKKDEEEKRFNSLPNKKWPNSIKTIEQVKEIFPLDVLLKNWEWLSIHQNYNSHKDYVRKSYWAYWWVIKKSDLINFNDEIFSNNFRITKFLKENTTEAFNGILLDENLTKLLAIYLYWEEAEKLISKWEKNREKKKKELKEKLEEGEKQREIEAEEIRKAIEQTAIKAKEALDKKEKTVNELKNKGNLSEEHEKFIKDFEVDDDWKKVYWNIWIEKINKILELLPNYDIDLDELEIDDLKSIDEMSIHSIKNYLNNNFW